MGKKSGQNHVDLVLKVAVLLYIPIINLLYHHRPPHIQEEEEEAKYKADFFFLSSIFLFVSLVREKSGPARSKMTI